jgi:hypothetical protein
MNSTITSRSGYDILNEEEWLKDAFRDYGRFLVGLALLVEPDGMGTSAECSFCSGFIMQFGRKWFWIRN